MQAFAIIFFLSHTLLERRLWKYLMANIFVRNKKQTNKTLLTKKEHQSPIKTQEKPPNKQKAQTKNPQSYCCFMF